MARRSPKNSSSSQAVITNPYHPQAHQRGRRGRYPSTESQNPPHILITWGDDDHEQIAELPHNVLRNFCPHIFANVDSLNRASRMNHDRVSRIDIRPRDGVFLDREIASFGGIDQFKKAATVILQYFEYHSGTLSSTCRNHSGPSMQTNPITRFLEKGLIAELENGSGFKTNCCSRCCDSGHFVVTLHEILKCLGNLRSLVLTAKAFGCLQAIRMILEHFLLVWRKTITAHSCLKYHSENAAEGLRVVIGLLDSRGSAEKALEELFEKHDVYAPSTGLAEGSSRRSPRLGTHHEMVHANSDHLSLKEQRYRFESSLDSTAPTEIKNLWRKSKSAYAVFSPEKLEEMLLGYSSSGSTALVSSRTAVDGEIFDKDFPAVVVEIKQLDTGYFRPSRESNSTGSHRQNHYNNHDTTTRPRAAPLEELEMQLNRRIETFLWNRENTINRGRHRYQHRRKIPGGFQSDEHGHDLDSSGSEEDDDEEEEEEEESDDSLRYLRN